MNLFIALIKLDIYKNIKKRTHVKFKIYKITYSNHSLEQHDVSKKTFSDKALVYP